MLLALLATFPDSANDLAANFRNPQSQKTVIL
jgi:hypothetical protein